MTEISNLYRTEQLAEYTIKAMETAASLTAFARMPTRDFHDYANNISQHLLFKTIEYMHEFCFFVRKAIELSHNSNPEIIALARVSYLSQSGRTTTFQEDRDTDAQTVVLSDKDFYWIVNRIIHSQKTFVVPYLFKVFDATTPDLIITKGSYKHFGHFSDLENNQHSHDMTESQLRVFMFQSDYDGDDEYHYIDICDFIECFFEHFYVDLLRAGNRAGQLGYE